MGTIMATNRKVYSLTDLYESINDIHHQHDEGKMDTYRANEIALRCCNEFLFNNIEEPLFLCTWNDGDTIQVHTKRSLFEQYKDTNLFDKDEQAQDLEGNTLAVSVLEWIDAISTVNFSWQKHEEFNYDNFSIRRIA